MSDSNNDRAEQKKIKKILLALIAGALLTGCAQNNETNDTTDAVYEAALPSVTEYISEAESFRTENDEEEDADSETVMAEEAASSQTEAETAVPAAVTTAAPVTSEEAATSSETIVTAYETTSAVPSTTTAAETSVAIMTECSVPAAQSPEAAAHTAEDISYDKSFFENDLFIGDSISTGYSLYGFLNEKNVFAKIGLNPSSVLKSAVSTCYGEIGIEAMLGYTNPKRVYIMLGSNGIQWLSVDNMLTSTDTLVTLIKQSCPSAEVVIVSVPPVTTGYAVTVPDVNIMEKINTYNDSLSTYASENDMLFVDAASVLKDVTGYFSLSFAESDGMHFKSGAYRTLLNKIQTDVTDFELEHQSAPIDSDAATTDTATEVSEETTASSEEVTTSAESAAKAATDTEAETFVAIETKEFN